MSDYCSGFLVGVLATMVVLPLPLTFLPPLRSPSYIHARSISKQNHQISEVFSIVLLCAGTDKNDQAGDSITAIPSYREIEINSRQWGDSQFG